METELEGKSTEIGKWCTLLSNLDFCNLLDECWHFLFPLLSLLFKIGILPRAFRKSNPSSNTGIFCENVFFSSAVTSSRRIFFLSVAFASFLSAGVSGWRFTSWWPAKKYLAGRRSLSRRPRSWQRDARCRRAHPPALRSPLGDEIKETSLPVLDNQSSLRSSRLLRFLFRSMAAPRGVADVAKWRPASGFCIRTVLTNQIRSSVSHVSYWLRLDGPNLFWKLPRLCNTLLACFLLQFLRFDIMVLKKCVC